MKMFNIEIREVANGFELAFNVDLSKGYADRMQRYVATDITQLCQVIKDLYAKPRTECNCGDKSK